MSDIKDFEIESGVLKKYLGKGGDVVIPEGVTVIGNWAFKNPCREITGVDIPSTVTEIDDNAFFDCTRLTEITLPEGITRIGSGAFSSCHSLKSINIPQATREIELGAFWFCSSLESIYIPENVTEIGICAFSGCTSLTSITVSKKSKAFKDIGEALYTADGKKLICYPAGKKGDTVTLPVGLEKIEDFAIEDAMLTHIVLPDGLKIIGNGAFKGCGKLKSISIPNKIREIYAGIINGCTLLKEIRYRGPEANWVNFEKHPDWDKGAGKYTVIFNCGNE